LPISAGITAKWNDASGYPQIMTFLDPWTGKKFSYTGTETLAETMALQGIITDEIEYKVL